MLGVANTELISTKKVAFYTLGCKLNFSETSTIARLFENGGYTKVTLEEQPDVYVINTCSVTENADKKCKALVKKALLISPHAIIVVIGCYAQLKPQEIARIEGVDIVLGASEKFYIVEYIQNNQKNAETQVHACEIKDVKQFVASYSANDRTRTFLKIQDGCDYFCSFCTIPLARGRSRNDSISNVIQQAKEIASKGVKEIVLTGVNTGDFGKTTGETFLELIQELEKIDGIERFRISSIEPNLLTQEIIEWVAKSSKFVPHFHIPLQSGSDKILRLMRRRYVTELYASKIETIKQLMPDACIGVDVIVGFPDETDEDFLDTYNFINSLDVSYLHVFTYSERDNTTAVRMTNIVPTTVRQQRSKALHILSEKKKNAFYESQQNTTHTILVEAEKSEGYMYGFTKNYVKCRLPYNSKLTNTLVTTTIQELDRTEMVYHIGL